MISRLKQHRTSSGIFVAALLLTACGATDTVGPGAGSGTPVQAKEYMFTPATLTATANGSLTIDFKNDGTLPHNFSVTELNVDQTVQPGQSMSITITTADNATLTYFCKFHGPTHGMHGTLTVGTGGTPASGTPTPGATTPAPRYTY